MDWDRLQAFLAVARVGRVSAAATRLGVTHTTVARRLAALEAELGVQLFYKNPAGYALTPHGHNIVANAEAMERAAMAVAARAREGSGATGGRVRVAMPPEFASHWLAPRLGAFRTAHPRLDLQVLVGTRERDISRGEAELVVQAPRPRQQGLVAVRLGRTALALFAARALGGGKRWQVAEPGDLRGLPLLVYTAAFHMLQQARWFQKLLATAPRALETNSTHVLLAAARAGVGLAVLPHLVARDDGERSPTTSPSTTSG